VKLRVGKRAQQQANKIEQWWVENRPLAPTLFTDELERTFRYICHVANAGVRWPTSRRPTLRRILMPRSNNHVYFLVDEPTETVHVLAVWGAPRGTTPKL
jgi:plasmid stabilization system protein ParE